MIIFMFPLRVTKESPAHIYSTADEIPKYEVINLKECPAYMPTTVSGGTGGGDTEGEYEVVLST